jgi:hypothetical protein
VMATSWGFMPGATRSIAASSPARASAPGSRPNVAIYIYKALNSVTRVYAR